MKQRETTALRFQWIGEAHREIVLPMVLDFYQSDAVDHSVERSVLERTVKAVCNSNETAIEGYLLCVGADFVGYCFLSQMYACEVGGICLQLEEIYILPSHQGKGYGRYVLEELKSLYPEAKRIRLEVTEVNQGAKALYDSLGFQKLDYEQMVWEREERA